MLSLPDTFRLHLTRPRFLLALVVSLLLLGSVASATIVERVVAIVGDRAIFLSDLKSRARPLLLQVYSQTPEGAQRSAALSQVYSNVLERMIEEELQQRAATRQQVSVTAREIDAALDRLAKSNNITYQQLMDEAARTGLTATEYRQEIRRQLLEAKLINQRVQGRLRITEDDMREAYTELRKDERKQLPFTAAWIRITIRGSGADEARQLAERVVSQARAGTDFAALAQRHSDDTSTRDNGGQLARMRPGELPGAVDRVLLALDPGQIADPIRVGEAWIVLKLVEREASQLPPYAEAEMQLQNRVYLDKMGEARGRWMETLRRQTHVEVRL